MTGRTENLSKQSLKESRKQLNSSTTSVSVYQGTIDARKTMNQQTQCGVVFQIVENIYQLYKDVSFISWSPKSVLQTILIFVETVLIASGLQLCISYYWTQLYWKLGAFFSSSRHKDGKRNVRIQQQINAIRKYMSKVRLFFEECLNIALPKSQTDCLCFRIAIFIRLYKYFQYPIVWVDSDNCRQFGCHMAYYFFLWLYN